eukprot:ctg_2260.g740
MVRALRSGEHSDERSRRCMEPYRRRPGEAVPDQRPQQRQGAAVRPGDGVRHPRGAALARGKDGRHRAPEAHGVETAERLSRNFSPGNAIPLRDRISAAEAQGGFL